MKLALGLHLGSGQRSGGGQPPTLTNDNGTITATGGYPAPPTLTNDNGTITAEAA